jgi:hypothetical protein
MQMNLNGYWLATIVEGIGRIGALVSGCAVELTPATADQLRQVIQARTTAAKDPNPGEKNGDKRDLKPGKASTNWRVEWIKFGTELE